MDRSSKSFTGDNAKMAASLLMLLPGTPYMYYGEEIELMGIRQTSPEDASDARRRLPMIWSKTDKVGECKFPELNRPDLMNNKQVEFGANDLLNEDYSLVNHYKKAIQIRNKYPFIKNSVFTNKTPDLNTKYSSVLAYELSYGEESIIVIHNFSLVNVELDVSKFKVSKIADEISVSRLVPELNGNTLKIGTMSTVVLTK